MQKNSTGKKQSTAFFGKYTAILYSVIRLLPLTIKVPTSCKWIIFK